MSKFTPLLLISALILYFTIEVYATSTGRVLRTSTFDGGCGGSGCHGTTSNSATSLSLVSGNLVVDPLSTSDFTIRVSNSNKQKAGINIAVKTTITGATNIGNLAAPVGSGLQVIIDELTHTSPKDFSDSKADFSFKWTAPLKAGKYYLRAAGNAVDGDNSSSGDQWNWMTPLELIVRGVELTEPKSNSSYCVGNPLIIKWESAGIEDLKIELSTNSGQSWEVTLNPSFKAVGGNWTWNIPNGFQQGSKFRLRVSDLTDPSRKSEMTNDFGIYGQFTITQHPISKTMCPGDSITLTCATTGTGLKYQWRKNGFNMTGETDSILVLNNVNSGTTGFYGVVVSSNCFSPLVSDESNIIVRTPTTILKQPISQIACPGGTVNFQIDTDGQNITLQWYKDNRELLGKTEATLQILNVKSEDVGSYYCVVTGFCGTKNTNTVTLGLNQSPAITKQPVNQTLCEKNTLSLSVTASGSQNSYEWFHNNSKLQSSQNSLLEIKNIGQQNAGEYYCIVNNPCGNPVKSDVITLIVNLLPRITSQPQNRMVMLGDEVSFSVTTQYETSYQWRKDGKNITNAKESSYKIDSARALDNGDYDCVISNSCGSVNSAKANLLVVEPEPGPRLKFSNLSINFGDVFLGNSIDSTLNSFFTNIGNQTLVIDSIRLTNTVDTIQVFTLTFDDSQSIEPGESASIKVNFNPDTLGRKNGRITVYSNSIGEIPFIDLIGAGAKWDMVSNRAQIDFKDVILGESDSLGFRVFNQSDYSVTWIETEFDCPGNDFSITEPTIPIVIHQKSSQDVKVLFTPLIAQQYDCTMTIKFFGTDKILKLKLTGKGTGTSVDNDIIHDFNLFPNPSAKSIVIEFGISKSSEYKIDIYDNSGNSVYSFSGITNESNIRFDWDTKDNHGNYLPSGAYQVVLQSGNDTKSKNIIIIK